MKLYFSLVPARKTRHAKDPLRISAFFWGSLATLCEKHVKLVLLAVIDWLPLFILLRKTLTVLWAFYFSRFWSCLIIRLWHFLYFFSHLLQNIVIRKKIEEKLISLYVEPSSHIHYLLVLVSTSLFKKKKSQVFPFIKTVYKMIASNLVAKQKMVIKPFQQYLSRSCAILCATI